MYFKKIDMHGFKSFADPVSVEFHKGITCVVGPNGSGKSNISDALRWVLGEQSPKTLRGGKMEEVIFAGTVSRKSKGMAEVTLVIDNTDRLLDIDYAEVAITRKMYRSGESEYFINNNQCRLKDIRELIMDTGIAVDGYSIIGQGKISDIISNKTESRREIFEEAAGIVKYRSKKIESERKLESAHHNLERVQDIIGEIEGRIRILEDESVKAKEYLGLRDRQKGIEINITLKNIENIELKNEYLKDDMLETTGAIDSYRDAKRAIEADLTQNRTRGAELDVLTKETGDLLLVKSNELGVIRSASDVNEEKMAGLEKDCDRITHEIALARAKITDESEALSGQENRVTELSEQILGENLILKQQSEEANGFFALLDKAAKETEHRKNTIYELYSGIAAKKAELQSYENIVRTLARRKEQVTAEKAEAGKVNSDKRKVFENLIETVQEASAKVERMEQAIREVSAGYEAYQEQEREKSHRLQSVKIKRSEVSARKKAIEEMESHYEGYSHAVRFVMKHAESIGGIHGVVADLIEVPRGLETAVETALGQAMQNIVCDGDAGARKAIQMLKEYKAGRLTFLPIDGIRPNAFKDLKQALGYGGADGTGRTGTPEGVKGIASQCISYEAKYTAVMEYLLGRVVLVDNLEHAVKLSKQAKTGARFVTLEGDVINPGGAITGGASKKSTGNLLERKAEAKLLEEKLMELAEHEVALTEEMEDLKSQGARLQEELTSLRQERRSGEINLTGLKGQQNQIEAELDAFLKSEAKWQRELHTIEEEEGITRKTTQRLHTQIHDDTSSVSQMEARTDSGQKEYEDAKAAVDAHSEKMTETKLLIASLESEKNNHENLAARIKDYIAELTAQNREREELHASLQHQKNGLLESVRADKEQVAKRRQEITELEERHKAYQEEKFLLTRYLNEVEGKRAELDKLIVDMQGQKHELELKLAKNQSQVDGYKDRLWEEFEISYLHAIAFKTHDFMMNTAVKEAKEIKERMKALGEVNIGAIHEYETTHERHQFLTGQRDDITEAIKNLTSIIEDMDRTIRQKFKESFEQIARQFALVFKELFGGGTAELKLESADDIMQASIDIAAQPPGKRLQNINLMSGGEKTLTAIALMAAVLRVKPTPFVILDEVEAALDDVNIMRFAKHLQSFQGIQFVLVTHQKTTMEYADVLYGVTMPEQGISKVLSLKLAEDVENL